ncbi:MAG: leucine-rich repeat domain-containing protein [Oscillospiraceae bacterium]|nr:leucine-rich repeat domain-containing protein [Oscillospiraceae bacterium]
MHSHKRFTAFMIAIAVMFSVLLPASAMAEETKPDISGSMFLAQAKDKDGRFTGNPGNFLYTGEPITPEVKLLYKNTTLSLNEDYEVTYENNTEPGNAAIIINGAGNFTGTVRLSFKISKIDMSTFRGGFGIYTGFPVKPFVNNYTYNGLKDGTDYILSWDESTDLINSGSFPVTITGRSPACTGETTVMFTIKQAPVNYISVIPAESDGDFSAFYNGIKLTEGKDYEAICDTENKSFEISGLGNFSGKTNGIYEVSETFGNATIALNKTEAVYDSWFIEVPQVSVSKDGILLKEYEDYSVTVENTDAVGEATIHVKGLGDYAGKYADLCFEIRPQDINDTFLMFYVSFSAATVSDENPNGLPEMKLDYFSEYEVGKDFSVSYPENAFSDNSYDIALNGCGNYTGTIYSKFIKAAGKGTVTMDGWRYGSESASPVISSETNGTDKAIITYAASGSDTFTEEKPTEPGQYTVRAVFPATASYTEAKAECEFEIEAAALTLEITDDSEEGRSGILYFAEATDGSLKAIDYTGNLESLVIPDYLENEEEDFLPVTVIGENVFRNDPELITIEFPSTVTTVEKSAFEGCLKLETVIITDNLVNIADNAFFQCEALKRVIKSDSSDARANLMALSATPVNPDKGSEISAGAFMECLNLTDIYIAEGVTSIGEKAFARCSNLKTVVIPSSVKSIGNGAFMTCTKLETIVVPDSVTSSTWDYTFANCLSLRSVSLPSGMKNIGERMFSNCHSLSSITLPSGITSIGNCAFAENYPGYENVKWGMDGNPNTEYYVPLTSVTIPSGVKTLGDGAFQYARKLTSVTLPDGLTYIGSQAFTETALTSVSIPDSVTEIGNRAFQSCGTISSLVLPKNLKKLGVAVFAFSEIKDIHFTGNLPVFGTDDDFTVGFGTFTHWWMGTVYYPSGNSTYTAASMGQYGATAGMESYKNNVITWLVEGSGNNGGAQETPPADLKEWTKASPWAEPWLQKASENKIIPDCLKGCDMTLQINRREFASVCVKLYEALSGTKAEPCSNPFTDCDDIEVLKAFNVGITNGTSATTFSPDDVLTREQAATMLTRVYKKVHFNNWTMETDADFEASFRALFTMPEAFMDDANISSWAKTSVYFMKAKGIIDGVGGNMFAPRHTADSGSDSNYGLATREQALKIAVAMLDSLR